MHQRNATAALYDHNPGQTSEPGDAVTARWLQSAGLQHLASPLSSTGIDHRLLPHLLMQGYGAQSTEEKQKLYRLLRSLNFNSDSGPEPYSLNSHVLVAGPSIDSVYSPEMRGEFGAGLLDLHSMDDTELLSEHVMSEPFEPSSFMPSGSGDTDNDFGAVPSVLQKGSTDSAIRLSNNDKESNSKEGNLAKIKVVVRKRPLNKKEVSRKEDDIVTVCDNTCLTVHEPKLKVDLTAYVEKHEFCFDAVLSEHVSNDEVYRVTVEPIIPTIFERTKATCFAYGQTGSGKTFTMQPLPIKAAEDIVRILHQPTYRNQKYKLWLSYFEIYGGKLFDLLSDRRKLCMREDGRQQVCIVGLQEFEVSHVQIIKEYIEKGNATRSTGSTGANEESSRSHAILQLAIKKHNDIQQSKRQNDGNENKGGKVIGKISFIDLAGSERGADTTDNDRQTRIEGAEINKSLLALKECIRALDNDQIHIPFRGSKLTEVLRDSFVGNSRTVMISCISPNEGSCEHTLNTLRYADRVKSLSKGATSKKDQAPGLTSSVKESSISIPVPLVPDDAYNSNQDAKLMDTTKKFVDKYELEKTSSNFPSNRPFYGREEIVTHANSVQRERFDTKSSSSSSTGQRIYSSVQNSFENVEDEQEKVQKISSHRRHWNEEKSEKQNRITNRDDVSDPFTTHKQQNLRELNSYNLSRAYESDLSCSDGEINAVLEEEEDLISAHRKEIEDTMEIVREEMKLLAEIDQPGSLIDNYVTQLNFLISRKAAGLVSLQNRLSRFQHRLKEQDIYSHKKVLR